MRLAALAAIAVSSPAWAQVTPVPSKDDPRVQTVRFAADTPVRLQTAPGNSMTIMLAPGERIMNVNISNNAAYQVTLSDSRDSLILHTSMVLYQGAPPSGGTITLRSDVRSYQLVVSTSAQSPAPYVLRFTYNRSEGRRGKPIEAYKLSGNDELRPSSIRDDGSKTFIQWGQDQAIPAIFALDRIGREEMVDGYMRDGVFTIDRVHDRLVFRIDNARAEAKRRRGPSK